MPQTLPIFLDKCEICKNQFCLPGDTQTLYLISFSKNPPPGAILIVSGFIFSRSNAGSGNPKDKFLHSLHPCIIQFVNSII